MGFVVVHVHAVAMDLLAKAMPGSVEEPIAVTRSVNDISGCTVDLPAAHGPTGPTAAWTNPSAASLAAATTPNTSIDVRGWWPSDAGPGDVRVDRVRLPKLAPQVEQDEIVAAQSRRDVSAVGA